MYFSRNVVDFVHLLQLHPCPLGSSNSNHYEKIMSITTRLSSSNLILSDIFYLQWTSCNGHSFFIMNIYENRLPFINDISINMAFFLSFFHFKIFRWCANNQCGSRYYDIGWYVILHSKGKIHTLFLCCNYFFLLFFFINMFQMDYGDATS
jgi:hypothetical protein